MFPFIFLTTIYHISFIDVIEDKTSIDFRFTRSKGKVKKVTC